MINLYVINYALSIVTVIVVEVQFGLNRSGLSHYVGNVFGAWIFGWNQLLPLIPAMIAFQAICWWAFRGRVDANAPAC